MMTYGHTEEQLKLGKISKSLSKKTCRGTSFQIWYFINQMLFSDTLICLQLKDLGVNEQTSLEKITNNTFDPSNPIAPKI